MDGKLFDSELKVMGVLWREGEATVQHAETDELVSKLFDGSVDKLFAALVGRRRLSAEQLERLREIVGEWE